MLKCCGQNDCGSWDFRTGKLTYMSFTKVFGQSDTSNMACHDYDTQEDSSQVIIQLLSDSALNQQRSYMALL